LLALIAAGDVDAAAGFYDGRASSVREYCVQLCSPELVDQATLAAFVDFRARAVTAPPDIDADDILRRAAREVAAGRLRDVHLAECRAIAELLVARMNGELTPSEEPLEQHLMRCSTCRRTAARLTDAEAALSGAGDELPPDQIRLAWLELVGQEAFVEPDEVAAPTAAAVGDEERAVVQLESPPQELAADHAESPRPMRVRARRGGLVGAARRLASPPRRHQ
jgi:hypothetical protein